MICWEGGENYSHLILPKIHTISNQAPTPRPPFPQTRSCHSHLVCSAFCIHTSERNCKSRAQNVTIRCGVRVQNAKWENHLGRAARAVEWSRVPSDNQQSRKLIHEQFYWRWRWGVLWCVLADCLQREQCEIEQRSKLIRACMIDLSKRAPLSLSFAGSFMCQLSRHQHSFMLFMARPAWMK